MTLIVACVERVRRIGLTQHHLEVSCQFKNKALRHALVDERARNLGIQEIGRLDPAAESCARNGLNVLRGRLASGGFYNESPLIICESKLEQMAMCGCNA